MSDNKRVKVGTGITYGSAYMAGYRVYAKLCEEFGADRVNAYMPPAELVHKLQGILPDIEVRTVFTAGLNDARKNDSNGDGYSDDEIMRYVDEKPLPEYKGENGARVWVEHEDTYHIWGNFGTGEVNYRFSDAATLDTAKKYFDEAVVEMKKSEIERLKDQLAKMAGKFDDIAYVADAVGTTIRNARLHTEGLTSSQTNLDTIEAAWKRLMETIDSAEK